MIKKLFALLFVMTILLTGCAKPIDLDSLINLSNNINEFYYVESDLDSDNFEVKVWAKGNQFRKEVVTYRDKVPKDIIGFISNGNSDEITKYMIQNKNVSGAVSMPLIVGDYQGIREESFLKYIDMIDRNQAEIVGEERVEGRASVIIKTNIEQGVAPSRIWLDKRTGIPNKVELAKDGRVYKSIVYKNIRIGKGTVSDTDFDVPEDAKILEE